MTIKSNSLYIFTKSGNQVRTVAPAEKYLGQPCWTVERTSGVGAGKRMTVPASALATTLN
jgi:hypothetical protein